MCTSYLLSISAAAHPAGSPGAAADVAKLLTAVAEIFQHLVATELDLALTAPTAPTSSTTTAATVVDPTALLVERDFAYGVHGYFVKKFDKPKEARLNLSLFMSSLGARYAAHPRLLWFARFAGLQLPDGLEHVWRPVVVCCFRSG